ncbi:glutamine--fructose-6-phosphate transaminase (isomerizing) [Paraburkholderia sp. Ac-20336]|uniref:glutamine--fructose-6-phosphate transaminase (isomerizing) n=1 Tax=Burkholderiaceae TaxID=119060 RepID=UPI001422E8C8|nr:MULTISPECIES: glutamine--fructose-6-phosphate transaminase (isomerizing) [Burkholderiaceae]MBN3805583.1 glutamine--fructose-6-phosphate transaminase (isomerizing) [Paraburkholderia sp. Ac-20336]NIF54005.1 glutamine--fructose-6-phosphate transaminase (isomerizing) [Burkholderia sp. Ax-1724]
MCGIVGAVARENIVPVLVEGLRRLEYRGYDSCGVAVNSKRGLERMRSIERVSHLDSRLRRAGLESASGIAHTRWATHGAPEIRNAHPMLSRDALAVVHNGIIENYESLRDELAGRGYEFVSQTDTEVIAHLIHSVYDGDLFAAVREAVQRLHGAYAIAVVHEDRPDLIVGAREGSPLLIGAGEAGNFLASDALALTGQAERFMFLDDGDVCELTRESIRIVARDGKPVVRESQQVSVANAAVELGSYRHYMQKEIFEQPAVVAATTRGVEAFKAELFGEAAPATFDGIDSIQILACGTSYYAGLVAKYWLESIAKIRTDVEIASEYRYREPVASPRALVVTISQSGETADTLAALKYAQSLDQTRTLTICNVPSSAMVQLCGTRFLTQAGQEVGVASTKAFTAQLVALFMLAVTLGRQRGHVTALRESQYLQQLHGLPQMLTAALALEPQIAAWAKQLTTSEHALFLGRGLQYPIALEGALKLKEISYIHAEAYPAGELKHGPLALVTAAMPVIAIVPDDEMQEKMKSNIQEVRARGGEVYVLADKDTRIADEKGLHVVRLPAHYGVLSPVLYTVPLQLLAYHTACARGADVDKPRNLAKSVTVE